MRKQAQMFLLAALTVVAAGCGHSESPSQVDPTDYDDAPAVTPAPTGNQPGGPMAPGMPNQANQAVSQMQTAWTNVRTLSANYDLYEKSSKGTETANVKFYFQKPGKYRYEVSKHSSSIKNGSKSVFDTRTRKIESRLAGLLGAVPINGTLNDERSKSVRNYTLDQTDYATQTEAFFAPGAQVTQRGPGMLELARPSKYPGVEAMRVTLDPQKGLPITFELVEKGQVVYRKRITGLVVNPSLGSDKFRL